MIEASEAKKMSLAETELSLRSVENAALSNGASTVDEQEEPGVEPSEDSSPEWPVIDWLPIVLTVALPVPTFRVRDLLALEVGTVVATEWPNGDDLPLAAGIVQLAWVDMETVEQSMAVRLTRLL